MTYTWWWGWSYGPTWFESVVIRYVYWWWEHLPRWWYAWRYTDGWGSFGTIFVAVLAILASIWYNRRTLQQARVTGEETIKVMTQQRNDLRYDVLRKELSQWLAIVSRVERACGELLRRLQEVDPSTDYGGSPLVNFVDVGGPSVGALHSIVGQTIAEPMTNLMTQGIQIQMLTADYSVLVNMHFITQAIIGKIQGLFELVEYAKRSQTIAQDQNANYDPYYIVVIMAVAQDYQYTRQITWARNDLMAHVIRRFNPAAVGELQRVYREFPDVIGNLRPTSVWRPPPSWSQPAAAEPPDADTEPNNVPPVENESDE